MNLRKGSIAFIPISYFSFNSEATSPDDIEAISVRYYRILSPQYNPNYSLYKDIVAIRFPILSAGDKIFDLFKPPVTFPSLSDNRQNIVYAAEVSPDVPVQDENTDAVSLICLPKSLFPPKIWSRFWSRKSAGV